MVPRLTIGVGRVSLLTKSAKASKMSLTLPGACEFLNRAIAFWAVVSPKRLRRLSVLGLE